MYIEVSQTYRLNAYKSSGVPISLIGRIYFKFFGKYFVFFVLMKKGFIFVRI